MPASADPVGQFDSILEELSDSMENYAKLRDSLLSRLEFQKLSPISTDISQNIGRFAAVDSSSACIIDGGCFMVMASRVGAVTASNGKVEGQDLPMELPVNLALVDTSKGAVEKNYSKLLEPLLAESRKYTSEMQDEPVLPMKQPHPRDVDWLQLARAVDEWRQVCSLLNKLDRGDYILRDGALRADIRIPPALVEGILQAAAEKGVHIVGIVKRSTVPAATGQLMPLVTAIQKLGASEQPKSCWYTALPRDDDSSSSADPFHFGKTYIVQYHPLSEFVFWTDLNKYDPITPEQALTELASLCTDPVYIGYPYPLALIHNQVILRNSLVQDLRYDLQRAAVQANVISLKDWELLFRNFHEILDINVY
jgi:hypothetical protein